MIYIFCAIYAEAAPIIKKFELKKMTNEQPFDIFENQEKEICLVLTGIGQIVSATVVGATLAALGAGQEDFLINIGTCAGTEPGELVVMNKLINKTTGRTYYPDMIIESGFKEGTICTEANLVSKVEEGLYYDMEAAAIYEAASLFMSPHQMSFLKVVSDSGVNDGDKRILPQEISGLIENRLDEIEAYILKLKRLSKDIAETEKVQDQIAVELEKLSADMCCSVTMKNSLEQYLKYAHLSGIKTDDILEALYEEGKLPCGNRKDGKKVLDEFTRQLI